jgi:hypothetical protein
MADSGGPAATLDHTRGLHHDESRTSRADTTDRSAIDTTDRSPIGTADRCRVAGRQSQKPVALAILIWISRCSGGC